jgi:hypothetical protein
MHTSFEHECNACHDEHCGDAPPLHPPLPRPRAAARPTPAASVGVAQDGAKTRQWCMVLCCGATVRRNVHHDATSWCRAGRCRATIWCRRAIPQCGSVAQGRSTVPQFCTTEWCRGVAQRCATTARCHCAKPNLRIALWYCATVPSCSTVPSCAPWRCPVAPSRCAVPRCRARHCANSFRIVLTIPEEGVENDVVHLCSGNPQLYPSAFLWPHRGFTENFGVEWGARQNLFQLHFTMSNP